RMEREDARTSGPAVRWYAGCSRQFEPSLRRSIGRLHDPRAMDEARRATSALDDQLVLRVGPRADRHRLATDLAGLLARPRPRSAHVDLDDVVRHEQLEGPVDRDPQSPLEAGQAQQVVTPPQEPGSEAGDLDPPDLADA